MEILLGAALCVVIIFVILKQLKTSERRTAFFDGIFGTPMDLGKSVNALFDITSPAAEPEVEVIVEPPVVHKPKAPNRGNIRPVLGEEEDLEILPAEIHTFPDIGQEPATAFEDFNRRLFIHRAGSLEKWPETTQDDFPTVLRVGSDSLIDVCKKYLRPAYPVIIDHYGWWQAASINLEMDNTYQDPVIGAYLALPPHQRPVVVASTKPEAERGLIILRYGFEPLHLKLPALQPHTRRSLDYIFAALTGPRKGWLWFSVARMRKAVSEAHAVVQAEMVKVREAERTVMLNRHANRFAALWDMPDEVERLIERQDQPTLMPEDEKDAAEKAAKAKRAPRIVVDDKADASPKPESAEEEPA
ncbi:hypothetical protein BA939_16485 [Rhizobium sp. S41]|nr:hypothetical protein BA939_16485 [Rhizobium sp. S41]